MKYISDSHIKSWKRRWYSWILAESTLVIILANIGPINTSGRSVSETIILSIFTKPILIRYFPIYLVMNISESVFL